MCKYCTSQLLWTFEGQLMWNFSTQMMFWLFNILYILRLQWFNLCTCSNFAKPCNLKVAPFWGSAILGLGFLEYSQILGCSHMFYNPLTWISTIWPYKVLPRSINIIWRWLWSWYKWHPCTHLWERTTSLTSILLIFWGKLFLGEHLAHEDKWHPKFAFAWR